MADMGKARVGRIVGVLFGVVPMVAFAAKPGEGVGAGSLMQLIFGLIVVLGAIGFGAFLLRRFGKFSAPAGGALRVLGGLSLGTRERVVLMQVGDQQLLIGVAPGRVQTLHVLTHPVQAETPHAALPGGGFAERLAGLMKK
jgi:flagellar protein FliO/FliZ